MKIKIETQIETVKPNTFYFHEEICNGKIGKSNFAIDATVPACAIIIKIDDKRYSLDWKDVLESVYDKHIEITKEEKKKAKKKKCE